MEGCRRLLGGAQVGGRNALVLGVSPRRSLGTSSLANQMGKHVPSQVGNKVYESSGTEEDSQPLGDPSAPIRFGARNSGFGGYIYVQPDQVRLSTIGL